MATVTDLLMPKRGIAVPEIPSYIKFDGAFGLGEGTLLGDKSRYRSHGTISGATWATGAHGKCLDFNAADKDYVEITPTPTQLNFTSEDFSLIARVYVDDLTDSKLIFDRSKPWVQDGYQMQANKDGSIRLYTSQDGATRYTASTTIVSVATWYTFGISRVGAAVKTYINGVDRTSIIGTHIDPKTSSQTAVIGVAGDKVTWPFDGKIEFLRIFGGIALPAASHLAYHNALA